MIPKFKHFDQYSRLTIHMNIFRFSAINSKMNLKFFKSFPLVCRTRHDEFIDIWHQRFKIKTKSSYSFEDRDTEGETDGIDFGMYPQWTFEWCMTRLPKQKISLRWGKQYTSPVTLGGGIIMLNFNFLYHTWYKIWF